MAQLVFVHGVATRSGPALDAAQANMKQLFETTVFLGVPFAIYSPRWGDLVPEIPAEVFATEEVADSFSVVADRDDFGIGAATAALGVETGIGKIAADRPEFALDAVFATLVDEADRARRQLTPEELEVFARAVDAMDDKKAAADLVGTGSSDSALAFALTPDDEAMGISIGSIRAAIRKVTDRIRNVTSGLAYGLVRDSVRPAVGWFIGDVFAYLTNGALRERIRDVVRVEVVKAWDARAANEPFILVGHSMGGVILVDMLADPAGAGLPAGLKVDCLFTVGSQPGLFQAVGGIGGTVPKPGEPVPARAWIGNWFNVFDPIDPLAFAAESLFAGVEDLTFDSITGVASAHTTYFKRPQFYARFRARLGGLSLIR
ncbi:hypothetical protein QTN93_15090 [Sphingomonas aerolata]|uniref:hypothetical protein n=1 Tax=Sphingomonas aerolata TaxID=185951 RepID=UPI0035A679E0